MGYSTDFVGHFDFNSPLDTKTLIFLKRLATTRRMARDLGPEYGVDGEFYVDGAGYAGQDREPNILDYNSPPSTQPSLWCQWVPNATGTRLEWDQGEKFYNYVKWLQYIVERVLAPCGYSITGEVRWQGEDPSDRGIIIAKNNVITVKNVYATLVVDGHP